MKNMAVALFSHFAADLSFFVLVAIPFVFPPNLRIGRMRPLLKKLVLIGRVLHLCFGYLSVSLDVCFASPLFRVVPSCFFSSCFPPYFRLHPDFGGQPVLVGSVPCVWGSPTGGWAFSLFVVGLPFMLVAGFPQPLCFGFVSSLGLCLVFLR